MKNKYFVVTLTNEEAITVIKANRIKIVDAGFHFYRDDVEGFAFFRGDLVETIRCYNTKDALQSAWGDEYDLNV